MYLLSNAIINPMLLDLYLSLQAIGFYTRVSITTSMSKLPNITKCYVTNLGFHRTILCLCEVNNFSLSLTAGSFVRFGHLYTRVCTIVLNYDIVGSCYYLHNQNFNAMHAFSFLSSSDWANCSQFEILQSLKIFLVNKIWKHLSTCLNDVRYWRTLNYRLPVNVCPIYFTMSTHPHYTAKQGSRNIIIL